jgi:peptidoglycan hydrolase-like protein with peptidoglycan-binding domain
MPMRRTTTSLATAAAALALTVAPLGVAFAAGAPATPATSSTPARTESSPPMHPGHQQWSQRTALVQDALNSTGAKLKVDGVSGPNTEQALKNYQRQNNLQVTGQLDHATMTRLDPIG